MEGLSAAEVRLQEGDIRTLLALAEGETFGRYCPIELAVAENTLFALPPINRSVPTTITKMTASITAYSAISCPSSCDQSLPRKSVTFAPPRASILYLKLLLDVMRRLSSPSHRLFFFG